jgi:hypothetical protein
MAVSGTQIAFAQEARPYALALALTLAAAWAVARIAVKGFSWGRGLGMGGAVLALMLTHYTGIAPAFAVGLFAVLVLRRRARWLSATVLIGAGAIFFLLWGSFLLGQTGSPGVRLAFLNDASAGHALRTLDRVLQQPLALLLWSPRPGQQPPGWAWAARGFGLIVLVLPLLLMRRRPALLLAWLLAAGPIVLTAVSDLASTRAALELPRFSFLGSAGVAMVLALLAALLPARWTAVAGGVMLLVLATALLAPQWIARPSPYDRGKPDARAWAARLAAAWRPGEAIVIARPADLPWSAGAMWLAISHYAAPPGPLVVLDGPADDALTSRLATAPGVWMMSPTPGLPVEPLLPGWRADGVPIQRRNLGTAAPVRVGRVIP